jgi:hypothetical protein
MGKIFGRAEQVIVYLGPRGDGSDKAIQFSYNLSKFGDDKELAFKQLAQEEIREGVARLFDRAYWRRIWMVQEIALAKDIVVYCGRDVIDWSALCNIQRLLRGGDEDDLRPAQPGHEPSMQSAVWKGPYTLRLSREAVSSGNFSIYQGLQYNIYKQLTDPRDMVYGLAALQKKGCLSAFPNDYSWTIAKTYTEFAKYEIMRTHKLDIVTKVHPDRENEFELPSWVPDWSFRGIKPGHKLLQTVLTPRYIWRAACESEANVQFTDISDEIGSIMTMQAIEADCVGEVGVQLKLQSDQDLAHALLALHEWRKLTLKGRAKGELKSKNESFVRAVLAGSFLPADYEDIDPSLTESEFLECLLGYWGDLLLEHKLINSSSFDVVLLEAMAFRQKRDPSPDKNEAHWQAWTNYAMQFIWDRSFFVTSSGAAGIGPITLEKGDICCVPLGCCLPVIVKPIDGHYTLVGETYVDGISRGEALEMLSRRAVCTKEFEIH